MFNAYVCRLGLKHNISPEQEELGERLFVRVASIDSELCAQITGN